MPSGPVGLVADGTGTVWAAIPASGALVQVSDPDAAPADVGDTPLRAAFSGDELWVSVFGAGVLAEVDAATGDVTRTLEGGAEPEGIADGFGPLWVLEPARKSATDRRVWPRVKDMLWVACTRSSELIGIAADVLTVVERIEVAGNPDALGVGADGTVVVALQEGPALRLLDAPSAELGAALTLSDKPQLFDQANIDVLVADDRVWLTSYSEAIVYELPLSELG